MREREIGEGAEVGQSGPCPDVCAERKLLQCLFVDGGLVHGEADEQGGPYSDV